MKEYYDNDKLTEISYLIDCKKIDAALQKYNEYILLYPNDIAAKGHYMQILSMQQRYEEAESFGKDLIKEKFRNNKLKARVLMSLAMVLNYQDKVDEAIKYTKEACDIGSKTHFSQLKFLIDLYLKKNDTKSAGECMLVYKKELPKEVYNLLMGEIEYANGDYDMSVAYLNDTLDYKLTGKIDIQKKYLTLGKSYFELKKYTKATESLKKVLSVKNIYFFQAYFYLACINAKIGKISEAIYICEDIIKHNQDTLVIRDFLNSMYIKKGQTNKAIKFADTLENQSDKKFNLGKIELKKGNFAMAENFFEESLHEDDIFEKRKDMKIYYYITTKFKLEKYDEVLELINKYYDIFNKSIMIDLKRLKYYIYFIQGKRVETTSYTAKQIENYDEEAALKHVIEAHEFQFRDEIDVRSLFYECKDLLSKENLYNFKGFDVYKINYRKLANKTCNYSDILTVVCVPKTKNILTMYPDKNSELRVDDLDIEDSDINPPKTKRLSQIEKFNKKYNM